MKTTLSNKPTGKLSSKRIVVLGAGKALEELDILRQVASAA